MRTLKLLTLGMFTACTVGAPVAPIPAAGDFGWLSGHWCSEDRGELVEEQWLKPRGDLMLGLSRTTKAGKTTSFEFLRIEFSSGVSYVAQPGGAPPTTFRLTGSGADWARFENPDHDFPKRVEYRRTGKGLHAEVAGPGKDGKELVIPFEYSACQP